MPYPVLPEDFAGRAALLRRIGDVIQGPWGRQSVESGVPIVPGTDQPGGMSPPPPGGRLSQQQLYEAAVKEQQLRQGLELAKRTPHPMDQTRDEISRLLGHERPDSLSPLMKPGMPGYNPRTDRPPGSGTGPGGIATHVDLVQMGKDYGLSYDRMVLALNGTQAAGMKSTPENIKYWIAQMRQKGLFHPETEGGE